VGFTSVTFLAFFCAVFVLYRAVRGQRVQNLLLLLASYVFYGSWDWRFLGLIWLKTLFNFAIAFAIDRATGRRRKQLAALSIAANLLPLLFFKYWDFGVRSLATLLGSVGLGIDLHTLGIVLPLGISFYTFQSMSYPIDVYRREQRPTRDLLAFALYIAYFPQLLAGPIERAKAILPQLQVARSRPTREDVRVALGWLLSGYFLKVVLADTLSPMVDQVHGDLGRASGAIVLTSGFAFAVQIYCDFAGYSLIARGLSRLLGIGLMQNFRQPYLARSTQEIWSRWHISLATWMRDYVYVPLGGSRGGRLLRYRNVFVTMALCGLWHGAAWPMLVFGLYHGALLSVGHAFRASDKRAAAWNALAPPFARVLLTQFLWVVGLLVFRSPDLTHLGTVLAKIATDFRLDGELLMYLRPTVIAWAFVMAHHLWQEHGESAAPSLSRNRYAVACAASFMFLATVAVGFQQSTFFYFQF
jgi:alginate O-acetyltransferase complex protein AlgI